MALLVVRMRVGIAAAFGCCSPRPPFLSEIVAIEWDVGGSLCIWRIVWMKLLINLVKSVVIVLVHESHSSGRLSHCALYTSETNKCVILCAVHVLKILNIVCLS